MGRTFLRQDAQVRNSVAYTDNIGAGSALESGSADLERDLNAVRSQLNRILDATMSGGKWYDDVYTPVGGTKRGVKQVNIDLKDIEDKRMLFRTEVLTDITVPAAVAATGSFTSVTGANLNDGETFTISDGIHTPVVFEFDSNSTVTPGYVAVVFTGGDSANAVAITMRTAINGAANLDVTAGGSGTTVSLTNDVKGSQGNVGLAETVANAGFVFTGMSGGAGDMKLLVSASSEDPTLVAAVDAGTAIGAVVKVLGSGVIGMWSSADITGPNDINPKNLCIIRNASNDDPILSGGKEVFGLLQAQSGTADGDSFDDATKKVQLSFVREAVAGGHTLEHVPADDMGGKVINYAYARRINLDAIPEEIFLTGVFIDQAASVDVTLDNAVDNQSGPVTQQQNIDWRIDDTKTLKFQDSTGGTNLIAILPNVGNDVVQFNLDNLDVNTTNAPDFNQGIKVATSSTEIDVGVTAGYINSTGAADLGVRAGGELYLDDGNQTGSTWVQVAGIKLSDTQAEWNAFRTQFGEISLLAAITQSYTSSSRSKTVGVLTANVPANTNVTGGTNLDATLGNYTGKTFVTDLDIYLNGQLMRNGANAGANHDVYPGTAAATGDLMFEFNLHGSPGNPDVITMIIN